MAIFTTGEPERRQRRRSGRIVGWALIVAAVLAAIVVGQLPTSYVIEEPGPVFNTIGTTTVKHRVVPVLSISGHKTYPTSGSLDMLTVDLNGEPGNTPNWAQVIGAWLDPSEAVVPIDEIYPPQQTVQQSNQQDAQEMTDSQQEATAAALYQLGIKFKTTVTAVGTVKGTPAVGVLKKGDIVTSVNGRTFVDSDQLHSIIVANGTSKPLAIEFTRKGIPHTAEITPISTSGGPAVGVYLTEKFEFPFPVTVQLQDVGGPSAGMMFALGIIDKLTPGKLNGGQRVAGTGTITAYGTVGAIGGIRQKMYGARAAGAKYFLAPASNCGGDDGVRGHIPAGLTVFATSSLKQSVADLRAIASGKGLNKLKTCG